MIDGYKELTPVIYGENAIKYLYTEQKKAEGEICFLLHWHDRGRCMEALQCRKRSAIIRSCSMWSGFIMERQRLKNIYVPWEMEN